MPPAESVSDGLGRGARFVVLVLGVLLVVHGTVVALWLAPSSPIRDAVGQDFLSSYVDPYFQQGSDTLGIGSNRVDESLQIRARVRDSPKGKPRTTPWLDVTEIETTALRGDLTAARSHQAARRLATTMNYAVLQLDPAQRRLLPDITSEDTPTVVREQLVAAGDRLRPVVNFVAADEMLRRFSSLWLEATLGDAVEILAVGYRVGRREVPDVDHRAVRTVTGRPFAWFELGSRRFYRGTPEARAAFDDYVRSRRG